MLFKAVPSSLATTSFCSTSAFSFAVISLAFEAASASPCSSCTRC